MGIGAGVAVVGQVTVGNQLALVQIDAVRSVSFRLLMLMFGRVEGHDGSIGITLRLKLLQKGFGLLLRKLRSAVLQLVLVVGHRTGHLVIGAGSGVVVADIPVQLVAVTEAGAGIFIAIHGDVVTDLILQVDHAGALAVNELIQIVAVFQFLVHQNTVGLADVAVSVLQQVGLGRCVQLQMLDVVAIIGQILFLFGGEDTRVRLAVQVFVAVLRVRNVHVARIALAGGIGL